MALKYSFKHHNIIFYIAVVVHSTIVELAPQNQEGCFLGHQAQLALTGAMLVTVSVLLINQAVLKPPYLFLFRFLDLHFIHRATQF